MFPPVDIVEPEDQPLLPARLRRERAVLFGVSDGGRFLAIAYGHQRSGELGGI